MTFNVEILPHQNYWSFSYSSMSITNFPVLPATLESQLNQFSTSHFHNHYDKESDFYLFQLPIMAFQWFFLTDDSAIVASDAL